MSDKAAALVAETQGAIRWIEIRNESRMNAFTRDMWAAVPRLVAEADADPAIRVVIFRGAGEKAFSAGADISEFGTNRTGAAAREYDEINDAAYVAISACTKPTIAMVRGYCFGGASVLALSCDMRVANDEAVFSIPAAKLSLGYNPRWIRPMLQVMTPARAKEMLFTGGRYGAEQALAMGMVNRVVASAALREATVGLADEIAANAPLSIRAAKAAVDQLAARPESVDLEALDVLAQACFASDDFKEGQRAFMEKRKPRFSGR
ncbi:MAG: enoyl-CoA hydratase [Hyphomicrobiaceae bacterium]